MTKKQDFALEARRMVEEDKWLRVDVAAYFGVAPSTVTRWLNGDTRRYKGAAQRSEKTILASSASDDTGCDFSATIKSLQLLQEDVQILISNLSTMKSVQDALNSIVSRLGEVEGLQRDVFGLRKKQAASIHALSQRAMVIHGEGSLVSR